MGRYEALIVEALGRSPYDDEIIPPLSPGVDPGVVREGQQYDQKGHPVNPQTRQWLKDSVRAANEVTEAAGIIENMGEVRSREAAFHRRLIDENQMGLQRLEIGRLVIIAGVWGVCGLRRRVMLYKSNDGSFVQLLQQQYQRRPLLSLAGAGLPVLGIWQALDWAGMLARAMFLGPYQPMPSDFWYSWKSLTNALLDNVVSLILFQMRMFGTLQQLELIPATRLCPTLLSIIPFTRASPFQWPGFIGFQPALHVIATNVAPMVMLWGYVKVRNEMAARIYTPLAQRLPCPTAPNTKIAYVPNPESPPIPEEQLVSIEHGNVDPSGPRSNLARRATMDSMGEENYSNGQAALSFEFEEATPVVSVPGAEDTSHQPNDWSAELRSSDPRPPTYLLTALTILPSMLSADSLSLALAEIATAPLEAMMVRGLAEAFMKRAGKPPHGFWPRFEFSINGVVNVLCISATEIIVLGILCISYSEFSRWLGGVPEDTEEKDDRFES